MKYTDILEKNAGNLNVPRYIQKIDDTLPQNIAAHLKGGIPGTDIDSLKRLWNISPALKQKIFICTDERQNIYHLALPTENIEEAIRQDVNVQNEKRNEVDTIFTQWRDEVKSILLNIDSETNPKQLIRTISSILWMHINQRCFLTIMTFTTT